MNQLQPEPEQQPDDLTGQNSTELTQPSLPQTSAAGAAPPDNPPVKFNWGDDSGWSNPFPDPPRQTPAASSPEPSGSPHVTLQPWAIGAFGLVVVAMLVALVAISVKSSTDSAHATAEAKRKAMETDQAISQLGTSEARAATSLAATTTAQWRATGTAEAQIAAAAQATATAEAARTATAETRLIQNGRATATAEWRGTATTEAWLNVTATAIRMATGTAEARATITYNETALAAQRATATAEAYATATAIAATETAVAARPDLVMSIIGCNIEYDLFSRFGQVANAWVTVQNIGTAKATNVDLRLLATDEAKHLPDAQKVVTTLPPGYQITQKLTVDTYLFKTTDLTVVVSSNEGAAMQEAKSACSAELDGLTKTAIEQAGELGKIMLIATRLK